MSVTKNNVAPPNHASCAGRRSRTRASNPMSEGIANAAGNRPMTGFGHAALTSRYTSVKCTGAESADTAQGMTRSAISLRNTNGKIMNTAVNVRYHTNGTIANPGLNRVTCHAYSSAAAHASATAASKSVFVHLTTPSSNTTSSIASPNTGDGFASGNRTTTMTSSTNGNAADNAGICTRISPGNSIHPVGRGISARRAIQIPIPKNTNAKPPITTSKSDSPANVAGIFRIHSAVAASVSTNAPMTASSDAVTMASPNTTASIAITHSHTSHGSSGSFRTGIITSARANNGNKCAQPAVGVSGRSRCSTTGSAACNAAKSK